MVLNYGTVYSTHKNVKLNFHEILINICTKTSNLILIKYFLVQYMHKNLKLKIHEMLLFRQSVFLLIIVTLLCCAKGCRAIPQFSANISPTPIWCEYSIFESEGQLFTLYFTVHGTYRCRGSACRSPAQDYMPGFRHCLA